MRRIVAPQPQAGPRAAETAMHHKTGAPARPHDVAESEPRPGPKAHDIAALERRAHAAAGHPHPPHAAPGPPKLQRRFVERGHGYCRQTRLRLRSRHGATATGRYRLVVPALGTTVRVAGGGG